MTFFGSAVILFLTLAAAVCFSPLNDFNLLPRALSPAQCSSLVSVVSVLKDYQATSFCESFLSVKTQTSVSVTTTTKTVTTTTGTASTSVLFKAGQPPAKARREIYHAVEARDADSYNALEKRSPLPSYLTAFASSAVSSACQCLSVPTPLTTVKSISTATSTKSVPYPVKTRTVYPCATPITRFSPTLPYGLSSGGPGTSNNLNNSITSVEACCDLCYFGLSNCIQAYYFSYEGCVISQANPGSVGDGIGISSVCPTGQFGGLTYRNDRNPDFRSTGDFAGPCGMTYNNL